MKTKKINITIPTLARVEGEGSLELIIDDNQIKKLNLSIYEPPRFFEKFLEGRDYTEVLNIVARICGICPVAYQMSATQALEQALQIQITPWIHDMRRVFYCGEWIQSHCLHMHLLALPDFFGFNSAPEMAKKFPKEIKRGLALQAIGNELVELLGARSVHPVGACIGGFFQAPGDEKVETMVKKLKALLPEAEALIHWTSQLPFPDSHWDMTYVALHHPSEYAMTQGDIVSNTGLRISKDNFQEHFREFQVPHSTALHSLLHENPYMVGPMARINLNQQQLPEPIQAIMTKLPFQFPSQNMFHCIVARAIEVYYAIYHAIEILENYKLPKQSFVAASPKAGQGFGATEAPRGLLWQAYELSEAGGIKSANIIPPTSQNQANIESDLAQSLKKLGLDASEAALRLHSEMVIRNYDPCISCSTHFLDLRVTRL